MLIAFLDKRLSSLDVSNNSYDGREDSSLCQLIADGTVTELKLGSLFVPGSHLYNHYNCLCVVLLWLEAAMHKIDSVCYITNSFYLSLLVE